MFSTLLTNIGTKRMYRYHKITLSRYLRQNGVDICHMQSRNFKNSGLGHIISIIEIVNIKKWKYIFDFKQSQILFLFINGISLYARNYY